MALTNRNKLQILTATVLFANVGCSGGSLMSSLDPRFQSNDSVTFVKDGVDAMSSDVSAMASGLSISLGLAINPPATSSTGGTQVYASDLRVAGNRVVATYNVPGNVQRGWVDYIDVTTLAVPLLVSSQYFADTDINSVTMSGGKLALVGAKENIGPVLRTGTYSALGAMTIGATETALPSYAGTGAVYNSAGTKLAITSGDSLAGGLNIFDAVNLSTTPVYSSVGDARGVTYHSGLNKYYVVKGGAVGGSAAVVEYDGTTGTVGRSVNLPGATTAESKSTIVAGTTFLLATSGDGGFSLICAQDMQIAATQSQYIYPNYAASNLPAPALTVSNAAAFGPGMIFVAAGQAGVRVYNFTKKTSGVNPTACQNIQVSYLGYFEFSNTLSANNVVYANVLTTLISYSGVLYVADGAGGFKAVTVTATKNSTSDIIEF